MVLYELEGCGQYGLITGFYSFMREGIDLVSKKMLISGITLIVLITVSFLTVFVAIPVVKKVNYANLITQNAKVFNTLNSTEIEYIVMGTPGHQYGTRIDGSELINSIMTEFNSYSYAPTGETRNGNFQTLTLSFYTSDNKYNISFSISEHEIELNGVLYNYKSTDSLFTKFNDICDAQYTIQYPNG